MCFGCAPTQPQYTDTVNKKITICKSAAEKIWSGKDENGAQLSEKQDWYDVFGLRGPGNTVLIQSIDTPDYKTFF